MGTTQPEPKRARKRRGIKILLALAVLTVSAGFSGPGRPVCERVPSAQTGQPADVIVLNCKTTRWSFHFPPRLW